MDAELRKRNQNLENALKQRDEEWKDKIDRREKALKEELRARENAFISDQLKRYKELLEIMKEKEDAMEQNMLQNLDAFEYLYKEHQKEIRLLIEKRDKEMEATLNYREKLWTESLHMVNNNLIKMYSAQGEFEGVLNSIGQRQDDLIKQLTLSMEWFAFNKEEGSKARKPPVQFLDFSPSSAGYKFEPVNLIHPNKYEKKKRNDLPCCPFLISIFVTKSFVNENINEKSVVNICVHSSLAFFSCLFSFSFLDFK